MTMFRYRAVDDQGVAVDGTMEEASAHRVTQRLQERGLQVNSVEEMHKAPGLLRVSTHLTWDELNLFAEQLQAIARSSLPLAPSLKALAADLRNRRMKTVLDRMCHDLERGESLEQAVTNNHESFPRLFVSIIRAGEATGNLSGVLQLLSSYTARMVGLKNTLQVALAYPITVLIVAAFILGFMLVKVVPVFADIFNEFGGQLPWPTQFWVQVSDGFVHHWQGVILNTAIVAALVIIVWKLLRRSSTGRCWLDSIRLHIPIVGHVYYQMCVARFARTLGLLLGARVPVLDSLELAAASSGSAMLEQVVNTANLQVAGGERIADALSSTGFFGHSFCWLLATGEDRGEAELALNNLADSFEREALVRDRMMAILLTPVLVLGLGLIIVSIIVALYLPIFTLGDVISGT